MSEEGRVIHHHHESKQPSNETSPPPPPPPVVPPYGTFEGIPSSPSMGFPQPAPPYHGHDSIDHPPQYYSHAYQAVPGYAVADGTPVRDHHRLPCCGLGFGWFLFILGFFLGGFPWYAAAIYLLLCSRNVDPREKPGYICCTVFSVLGIIVTVFGLTKADDW